MMSGWPSGAEEEEEEEEVGCCPAPDVISSPGGLRRVARDVRTVWLLERAFEGRMKATLKGFSEEMARAEETGKARLESGLLAISDAAKRETEKYMKVHSGELEAKMLDRNRAMEEEMKKKTDECLLVFTRRLDLLEARASIAEERFRAAEAAYAARDALATRDAEARFAMEMELAAQSSAATCDEIMKKAMSPLEARIDLVEKNDSLDRRVSSLEQARDETCEKWKLVERSIQAAGVVTEEKISKKFEKRLQEVVETEISRDRSAVGDVEESFRATFLDLEGRIQAADERMQQIAAAAAQDTVDRGKRDIGQNLAINDHADRLADLEMTSRQSEESVSRFDKKLDDFLSRNLFEKHEELRNHNQHTANNLCALAKSFEAFSEHQTKRMEANRNLAEKTSNTLDALIDELKRREKQQQFEQKKKLRDDLTSMRTRRAPPAPSRDHQLSEAVPEVSHRNQNTLPTPVALHNFRQKWNSTDVIATRTAPRKQLKKPPRWSPTTLADSHRVLAENQPSNPENEKWDALRRTNVRSSSMSKLLPSSKQST